MLRSAAAAWTGRRPGTNVQDRIPPLFQLHKTVITRPTLAPHARPQIHPPLPTCSHARRSYTCCQCPCCRHSTMHLCILPSPILAPQRSTCVLMVLDLSPSPALPSTGHNHGTQNTYSVVLISAPSVFPILYSCMIISRASDNDTTNLYVHCMQKPQRTSD